MDTPVQILDARSRIHFSRSSDTIAGAVYRDPDRVYQWDTELSTDIRAVVFCAYGFNVGCALSGVRRGHDARVSIERYLLGQKGAASYPHWATSTIPRTP